MFLHKKNALKRASTLYHIVLYKEIPLKTILTHYLIKNIHQDTPNCTLF